MISSPVYTPNFKLTPAQKQIDDGKARYKFVKASRRFGKTKYGVRWQIKQAIKTPGVAHWYVTPTQKMAHEIAWDEYIGQLGPDLIRKSEERALTIELVNNARIYLKGSDKIGETLRGRKLGSAVLDEAAYHRSHVWPTIIQPMLLDMEAPALFISTPKKSWFSKMWAEAKQFPSSEKQAWHFTVYDNPYLSKDAIARIRGSVSEDVWQQEYMANEVESCGIVLLEFSNDNVFTPSSDKFQGHTSAPCVMGADWGIFDPTAVAWLHFLPSGIVVVSAEHVKANWDVARHSEIIKQKSNGRNIGHGCSVLDASAFRREGEKGTTIADAFKKEDIVFVKATRDADGRTELLKRYLRGSDAGPWIYFSTICKEAILAASEWEHGEHEPDIIAAIGYALELGVRKGMSRMTDLSFMENKIEDRPQLNTLKRVVDHRWMFDTTYGVPE